MYCVRSETGCPVHVRRDYPNCPVCEGEVPALEVPVCGQERVRAAEQRWALDRFVESLDEGWRAVWARLRAAA